MRSEETGASGYEDALSEAISSHLQDVPVGRLTAEGDVPFQRLPSVGVTGIIFGDGLQNEGQKSCNKTRYQGRQHYDLRAHRLGFAIGLNRSVHYLDDC